MAYKLCAEKIYFNYKIVQCNFNITKCIDKHILTASKSKMKTAACI